MRHCHTLGFTWLSPAVGSDQITHVIRSRWLAQNWARGSIRTKQNCLWHSYMNFDRKNLLSLDQNSYDYKPETVNRPPPTMRREDAHQWSDSQWLQKEKKMLDPPCLKSARYSLKDLIYKSANHLCFSAQIKMVLLLITERILIYI